MALKIQPASPEEHAFAAEVNKRLTEAKVIPFAMADPANPETPPTYHLTVQLGSKRTTLTADAPFHLDSPEDVIKRVNEWSVSLRASNRWSTDLKYAD